jgi:hypothetical protein
VNWLQTGNPVFPFLNDVFQSPYWAPEQTATVVQQMRESGIPVGWSNWWAIVTNFWALGTYQTGFNGNIGIFYLLLIPLLLFQEKLSSITWCVVGFSFFYWLVWLVTGQHSRYFLAALPGLAVVAAWAAVCWIDWVRRNTVPLVAAGTAVLLISLAVLQSPFLESFGSGARYGTASVWESVPWKVFQGQETRDAYRTRYLPPYPAVQFLNELPGRKKAVFWWNTTPLAFHLQGDSGLVYSYYLPRLSGENTGDLLNVLREQAITHVIVGQDPESRELLIHPEREFTQTFLRRLYQKNGTILYEVSSEPLVQDKIVYEFLRHIDEARITMPREPAELPNTSFRGVVDIAKDARYSLITRPPAEVEYTLLLPNRPVLRFSIGRRWPSCTSQGSFQLRMRTEGDSEIELFQSQVSAPNDLAEAGWFDEEIPLYAYAGQRVTITFRTDQFDTTTCDWFLWADPQIVSMPARVGGDDTLVSSSAID